MHMWFKNSNHLLFLTVIFFLLIQFVLSPAVSGQPLNKKQGFTRQDTLRGSVGPERAWWNVTRYDIEVKPNYLKKEISGYTQITAGVLKPGKTFQLDLQVPMEIDSVLHLDGANQLTSRLKYQREGNAWHVDFDNEITA